MWGQISGVAGQFKKTINAVASEIKDAVEEVNMSPQTSIIICDPVEPLCCLTKRNVVPQ